MGVNRSKEPFEEALFLLYNDCIDGAYVPRLFFISPQGTPLMDVMAVDRHSRFKYYYFSEEQLIKKMQLVKAKYE